MCPIAIAFTARGLSIFGLYELRKTWTRELKMKYNKTQEASTLIFIFRVASLVNVNSCPCPKLKVLLSDKYHKMKPDQFFSADTTRGTQLSHTIN